MIPLLVPNVVICTENVVTHALPNLSREKKANFPSFPSLFSSSFFSSDRLGSAWVTTFSVPITTLGTSNGISSRNLKSVDSWGGYTQTEYRRKRAVFATFSRVFCWQNGSFVGFPSVFGSLCSHPIIQEMAEIFLLPSFLSR